MDTKKEPKLEDTTTEHRGGTHRRRRQDRDRPRKHSGRHNTDADTFHGEEPSLREWVYVYDGAARANQYDKTTEAIVKHVKKTITLSHDVWSSMETLAAPDTDKWAPADPKEDSKPAMARYNEDYRCYKRRVERYGDIREKVFTIVLGQCSGPMQAKLEGQENWEDIRNNHNLVELLKSAKVWMLNQQSTSKSPAATADSSIMALYKLRQGRYEPLVEYRKRFLATTQVLKHISIDLGCGLVKMTDDILNEDNLVRQKKNGTAAKLTQATEEQLKAAEVKALDELLAMRFICSVDKARYNTVTTDLENDFVKGNDEYPKCVTSAYNMLSNWKTSSSHHETPSADGLAFAQTGKFSKHNGGYNRPRGRGGSHSGARGRRKVQCPDCGKYHDPDKKCKCNSHEDSACTTNQNETANHMTEDPYASQSDDDDSYRVTMCTAHEKADEADEDGVVFCVDNKAENVGELMENDNTVIESVMTHSFNERRAYVIPKSSIGLDSMSSVDIFGDATMLDNIRTSDRRMKIICNAGAVVVTQVGDLVGYGTVWYHPKAIANIISLHNLQQKFKVNFDSSLGNFFAVERPDGRVRIFEPTAKGLYVSKARSRGTESALVTTVAENACEFTKREMKKAKAARRLMAIVGRPSERQLKEIVAGRKLRNCTTTEQDIDNARNIFGPDVGSLKGKTVRRKEPHVELTTVPIPCGIMERHRNITLCFDVMYINSIPFAVSISRGIKFCTINLLENRRAETLLQCLVNIKSVYARRGFVVNKVAGDNEFGCLEGRLLAAGMTLNAVSRGEHVPEIERHIRTLKERCRAVFNTLPYRRVPKMMVIELASAMTFWLHAFPAQDGVSTAISPRELVTGIMLDADKHCVVPFGAYVQTHEEHDNSMAARTVGAIALRPTGNEQGGHFFMSLETGRRIRRNKWTEMPAPIDVVRRVEQMAGSNAINELAFGDRRNTLDAGWDAPDVESISSGTASPSDSDTDSSRLDDEEEYSQDSDDQGDGSRATADEQQNHEQQHNDAQQAQQQHHIRFKSEPEACDPVPEISDPVPESAYEQEQWVDAIGQLEDGLHEHGQKSGDDDNAGMRGDDIEEAAREGGQHDGRHSAGVPQDDDDRGEDGEHTQAGASTAGVSQPGEPQAENTNRNGDTHENASDVPGRYGMRRRKKPNYNRYGDNAEADNAVAVQVTDEPISPSFGPAALCGHHQGLTPLIEVILTQYGVKKGLRVFGKDGDEAVRSEMTQLHEMQVMQPKAPATLDHDQRRRALQYLMFLKKKRDGSIKGRGCADGRKQRAYTEKGSVSSPTVATEAVFLVITIAAKERRDVMVMDIPGAFLQTDLDGAERVLVKFEGRMAELLALIDPKLYRPHITVEKGRPVLYAELRKALYGMLQSALRFWQQVMQDLTQLGFKANPYDSCVANRIVNGKQQTVCWHVDDFLVTHPDKKVNQQLACWFDAKYGKRTPLTVRRGPVLEYLGMDLDFSATGKVKVTMFSYIGEALNEAPDEFVGTAPTPAGTHLFNTATDATDATALNPETAAIFHHMVAKLLYLSKRARPDLQLPIAFLCTRVKAPNVHDWKKLARVVQYLRGTRELALTLEADEGQVVKWWVDAAFAVTADMKSQSGATLSLGKGSISSSSSRQRVNTRSSTEAELVAASDFMPQVLWTRNFLLEQGYTVRENVLFQDNQSAILLETNGRASSGRRTRHLNIRYFFISDRAANGEVDVKHCPAAEMRGDFFTKPLQGAAFRKFRNLILNIQD